MKHLSAACVFVLAVAVSPCVASAQQSKVWGASASARLLLGGSYANAPSNIVPAGYEGVGFAGSSGGFAWGAAAAGELRLWKHLGFELSFGRDMTRLQREVTFNGVVKLNESVSFDSLRFGALVKGIAPTPFGRVWLGLGPEFSFAPSASGDIEITDGKQFVVNEAQVRGLISTATAAPTFLALGTGLVIHLGDTLELPIELRALRNLDQPNDWQDRVKLTTAGTTLTGYQVRAESTWDFRLGLGLGARF